MVPWGEQGNEGMWEGFPGRSNMWEGPLCFLGGAGK